MHKSNTKRASRSKTAADEPVAQLGTPKEIAAYLDARFKDAHDAAGIVRALRHIVRARGMTQVALEAGLNRENLYKALGDDGNPRFATILKIARAVGVRLCAVVA